MRINEYINYNSSHLLVHHKLNYNFYFNYFYYLNEKNI